METSPKARWRKAPGPPKEGSENPSGDLRLTSSWDLGLGASRGCLSRQEQREGPGQVWREGLCQVGSLVLAGSDMPGRAWKPTPASLRLWDGACPPPHLSSLDQSCAGNPGISPLLHPAPPSPQETESLYGSQVGQVLWSLGPEGRQCWGQVTAGGTEPILWTLRMCTTRCSPRPERLHLVPQLLAPVPGRQPRGGAMCVSTGQLALPQHVLPPFPVTPASAASPQDLGNHPLVTIITY